jgi:hypothetical protein
VTFGSSIVPQSGNIKPSYHPSSLSNEISSSPLPSPADNANAFGFRPSRVAPVFSSQVDGPVLSAIVPNQRTSFETISTISTLHLDIETISMPQLDRASSSDSDRIMEAEMIPMDVPPYSDSSSENINPNATAEITLPRPVTFHVSDLYFTSIDFTILPEGALTGGLPQESAVSISSSSSNASAHERPNRFLRDSAPGVQPAGSNYMPHVSSSTAEASSVRAGKRRRDYSDEDTSLAFQPSVGPRSGSAPIISTAGAVQDSLSNLRLDLKDPSQSR